MTIRPIFYACLLSLVAAVSLDLYQTSRVEEPDTRPAPILVRNQAVYDGVRMVFLGIVHTNYVKAPGTAFQLWNLDRSWHTRKAFSKLFRDSDTNHPELHVSGVIALPINDQ